LQQQGGRSQVHDLCGLSLALQDLAQLDDDIGGVALPQPRHDQRRPGVIGQRDQGSSIESHLRKHG